MRATMSAPLVFSVQAVHQPAPAACALSVDMRSQTQIKGARHDERPAGVPVQAVHQPAPAACALSVTRSAKHGSKELCATMSAPLVFLSRRCTSLRWQHAHCQ